MEVLEKATEMQQNWLASVQQMLEKSSGYFKSQPAFEKSPEAFKATWLAYEDFGKSWFESLRAVSKAKNPTDLNNFVKENGKKFQHSLINTPYKWASAANTMMSTKSFDEATVKEAFDLWKPVYSLN